MKSVFSIYFKFYFLVCCILGSFNSHSQIIRILDDYQNTLYYNDYQGGNGACNGDNMQEIIPEHIGGISYISRPGDEIPISYRVTPGEEGTIRTTKYFYINGFGNFTFGFKQNLEYANGWWDECNGPWGVKFPCWKTGCYTSEGSWEYFSYCRIPPAGTLIGSFDSDLSSKVTISSLPFSLPITFKGRYDYCSPINYYKWKIARAVFLDENGTPQDDDSFTTEYTDFLSFASDSKVRIPISKPGIYTIKFIVKNEPTYSDRGEIKIFSKEYGEYTQTIEVTPSCNTGVVPNVSVSNSSPKQLIDGGYGNDLSAFVLETGERYALNVNDYSKILLCDPLGLGCVQRKVLDFSAHYQTTFDNPSGFEINNSGEVLYFKVKAEKGAFTVTVSKKDHLTSPLGYSYCPNYKVINLYVSPPSTLSVTNNCLIKLPDMFNTLFPNFNTEFGKEYTLQHFNFQVSSKKGVLLKPGIKLEKGARLFLEHVPTPPSVELVDDNKNWVQSTTYDDYGNIIGESKAFFDEAGNPTQSQSKLLSSKVVLATQNLYDTYGRPALQSLPAPVNASTLKDVTDACGDRINAGQDMYFLYSADFMRNETGDEYSYKDFDLADANTNHADAPVALATTKPGTLGWYYSDKNNPIDLIAATAAATVASAAGTPDGTPRMYEPEVASTPYPFVRTLYKNDGTPNVLTTLGPVSYQYGTNPKQASDLTTPVEDSDKGLLDNYFTLRTLALPSLVNPPISTTSSNPYLGVVYKTLSTDIEGKQGVSYVDKQGHLLATHHLASGDKAFSFYDLVGRLRVSITPNAVKRYETDNTVSFAELDKTTLEYDTRGRLSAATSNDEGRTEFKYRKDGLIRFSQNANQQINGRFSYTEYDDDLRPIESGEYVIGQNGTAWDNITETILQSTEIGGGLDPAGTRAEWVRNHYDLPDETGPLPLAEYTHGTLAWTENERGSKSWHSSDERGRLVETAQNIPGLGIKTMSYTYAPNGQVLTATYQKEVPAEIFTHYYEYDADTRLSSTYTCTCLPLFNDSKELSNKSSFVLQASQQYYLHGPMKSMVIGDNLQKIDYTYTSEGWLKQILSDKFKQELQYYPNDYTKNSYINYRNSDVEFYNGTVSASVWTTNTDMGVKAGEYLYNYDSKYQLSNASYADVIGGSSMLNKFREGNFRYDPNGNLLGLKRWDELGNTLHDFDNPTPSDPTSNKFKYDPNYNMLKSVEGYADYTYNNIGQMVKETMKNGATIIGEQSLSYNAQGLVTKVVTLKRGSAGDLELFGTTEFFYDEGGQRIQKKHTDATTNKILNTYYVHGSMAIYDDNNTNNTLKLTELEISAGSRIGTYYVNENEYVYDLKDHLGNTRLRFTKKASGDGIDIEAQFNYYPYGLDHNGATAGQWKNRYKYQGDFAEKDEETGYTSFLLRQYNPVIGRWLMPDPKGQFASPYLGMGNNPVSGVDPDGGEVNNPIYGKDGAFLGTDNRGLQGEAIVMDSRHFTQNMTHEDALSKGTLFSKLPLVYSSEMQNRITTHFNTLSSRIDFDGVVTSPEARAHWNGNSGEDLFVDIGRLDLSPLNTSSFNGDERLQYNFFTAIGSDVRTGRVHGTLSMRLRNANTGEVGLFRDNNGFFDTYDFNSDGRIWRDFTTWSARRVVGEGTGFGFRPYGNNPRVPVVR